MEILVSQENARVPVTVLRLKDRINLGNTEQLVKQAQQAFEGGARDLLIDLSEVPTITSAGIRAIHSIYKLFTPESGKRSAHLKLLNPTAEVRRVLTLVGFDANIDIYEDLQEALRSF